MELQISMTWGYEEPPKSGELRASISWHDENYATQVNEHTWGFHFASQQKFLPKSGKRSVRTYGSVSPRRYEV